MSNMQVRRWNALPPFPEHLADGYWQAEQARDADFYETEFKKRGWDITQPDIIEAFFAQAGPASGPCSLRHRPVISNSGPNIQ